MGVEEGWEVLGRVVYGCFEGWGVRMGMWKFW